MSFDFFTKLTYSDLDAISSIRSANNNDSYLTSPAYHFFTGRKGAWLHRKNDKIAVITMHPNTDSEVLVFYPSGHCQILENEIENSIPQDFSVRVGRIESAANDNPNWLKVEETVLDWRYPICILDTCLVAGMKGSKLADVRNNYNRANRVVDEISFYKPVTDEIFVKELIDKWHHESCRDPYYKLLEVMNNLINNQALLAWHKSRVVGFIHWERSSLFTANSLALLADKNIRGLDEFLTVEMCRHLAANRVTKVNVGGSETQSLHEFKSKFQPEMIPLQSFQLKRNIV